MKVDVYLTAHSKVPKWIKDLNVKDKLLDS